MLFASPQARCCGSCAPGCPSLECVICCHFPVAPAHTSGGALNEFRTTALVAASPENTWLSEPLHNVSVLPEAMSRVEIAESPATFSVIKICFDDGDHWNQLGDDFRFSVRSRGSPPSAGKAKMSPPITPSSLMSPPINAIVL